VTLTGKQPKALHERTFSADHRISIGKRPRVYECYWAHFAAEIHLSE